MTTFNVRDRWYLDVAIDDGRTVTIEIEVSADNVVRATPHGSLALGEDLYVRLYTITKGSR